MNKRNMKIYKPFKLGIILLLVVALGGSTFGQKNPPKKYSIVDTKAKYGGINLLQTDHGSGLGLFFEYSRQNADRLTAEVNFILIKGYTDYPMYEYYDGYIYTYERSDRRRLTLMPFYLGYKKILFTHQIANNFRPFLEFAAGPVVGIDPPNIPDFSDRIKRIRFHYTGGFWFGAGAEFFYGPGTTLSIFCGYQYIRFGKKIDRPEAWVNDYYTSIGMDPTNLFDGQQNFKGLILKLGFGKRY
jgi:hypothetical protein